MDPASAHPPGADPNGSAAARPPAPPPPSPVGEVELYQAESPSLDGSPQDRPSSAPAPVARQPWEDRAWFVLVIVFGAALFLGYPLLWRTQAFRRSTKIWLSLLVAVETIVLFTAFYYSMRWSYLRVVDSLE